MRNPGYKVCIASIAPFIGGAEVAAERLALGLVAEGHEVVLVLGTRGAALERMERSGLRCLHAPMPFTDKWHWWKYIGARNALRRLLRRERPDVLHSNDLPTHQIVSDAARGLGVPRICHHRFSYGRAAIDWFYKFGSEFNIYISNYIMNDLCGLSPRLAAGRRSVVHDGLPLPARPTAEGRLRARRALGLPPEKVVVTFAGQIIECKGVADLIRAWSLLAPGQTDEAELVIIGEDLQAAGRYRAEMQRLAGHLRCPARFVGFRQDVGEWLLASDVAVVPSHVEPLSLATMEAMSHALPVIGSAVGGIPELIVPEETGLLVPPQAPDRLAAAIARMISGPDLRLRLGMRGRERCEERFGLKEHVRGILRVYRQVSPFAGPVLAS